MYVVHHLVSIPLYLHPWFGRRALYTHKMSSSLLLIEASNPFVFQWERSGQRSDLVVATAAFVLVRVFWFGNVVFGMVLTYQDDGLFWCGVAALYAGGLFFWLRNALGQLLVEYTYEVPPGTPKPMLQTLGITGPLQKRE